MAREKPICQRTPAWLKGRSLSTAALTGQDACALRAFVHLLELYAVADAAGRRAAVRAMRHTLDAMQPSQRELAKATIPQSLDWADEDRLWQELTHPFVAAHTIVAQAARGERPPLARWRGDWPTGTELEILKLLSDGAEHYGLQLVNASGGAIKRGTVYVLLDRLERKGLVESRLESTAPDDYVGIRRRLYRIRPVGVHVLHASAAVVLEEDEPVEPQPNDGLKPAPLFQPDVVLVPDDEKERWK